eukprot:CAMPEP_0184864430 /NCGR_PEP_ID=MMETSP0580-20130426/14928_1 /TAXON_ID=1118495 /ORGANISM="Dactyliosolen fragilissimus" /LENGTH=1284 /DNA_ID=CAMNT_0027363219 /DNA_START=16 /DNA_END=3870 /DNA_ORIENTATION=-
MHIKQITISNFRSFRQQPEIHPFSAGMNVVVGRNGSGKSNLFDAVQFVLLSPKFWSLRQEERQALLHEGSGSAAVNAFVEVVFDNSDGRMSLENSDEVVLRRTVGHKKDEFFLQRKRASRQEIMSLLEGAGFSKSNPYFIVQQGKVNALCVMSDKERLNLLKEVAGTTVYDEKKAESLKKMEDNRSSVAKIEESMQYMEERLDELKEEKEELTRYRSLDRQRRAAEYTLYDKELRRARESLDEIEHSRADGIEERGYLYELARDVDDRIRTVEGNLKTKTGELRRGNIYLDGMKEDKTNAVTLATKLDLQCQELEEAIQLGEKVMQSHRRELKNLNEEIAKAKKELVEDVQPRFDNIKSSLSNVTAEKQETRKKMEELYAKQGRSKQYTTKEERNTYLLSQIDDLEKAKVEKEHDLSKRQSTLANLRRSLESDSIAAQSKASDYSTKFKAMEELEQTLQMKHKLRNEAAEERKNYWRKLEDVRESTSAARERKFHALGDLRKVMPRATSMGLDNLTHIVAQEGIEIGSQYFGLLLQNFELTDDKFRMAVEIAAQNSLFHVIVDNDVTAARLMSRLEKDQLGRVTFLPLNRLLVEEVNYPNSPDIAPILTKCLKYRPEVEVAMKHVFGKKLLARNAEVASTWSARSHMDAITLEGDLCSRKGAMTGGYVDASKSRLLANKELTDAEEELSQLENELRVTRQKSEASDRSVSALMSEIQRLEAKKANIDMVLSRAEEEQEVHKRRFEKNKENISKIETDIIPPIEVEIRSLDGQINRIRQEMETELSETLTVSERSLLQNLKETHSKLEKKVEAQTQTLEEISVERQRLQSLLDDNLLKRKSELEKEGADNEDEDTSSSRRRSKGTDDSTRLPASNLAQSQRIETLEMRRRECNEANTAVKEIELKLAKAKKDDEALRSELVASKNELDKLRTKDTEMKKKLEEAQENEDVLMNKRSMCVSKRELYMRKIQELGSLPPVSELNTFTSLSISNLTKRLQSINKELKKYSHVNKKAYDQFVNFSEHRESLIKRKVDLDKGATKVQELIDNLDQKKDEAINRTFRGVSAHFKDVFKELVPNGAGELIMKSDLDGEIHNIEETESTSSEQIQKSHNQRVNLYRGIGVKVRFSAVGENYLMSQLSGGQKALVALGLIFAIQRCDPAPFYLFDELDQALDSTYRAAVAGLIQRQASSDDNPTQFICSTFRPELVAAADRWYGISHQNKVSSVHLMTKKDSLHFIANLMNEEEAVGEVTSLATSARTSRHSTETRKRKSIKEGKVALEETAVY